MQLFNRYVSTRRLTIFGGELLLIFGSVALWSPTDAFLFGMRPLYDDVRICKAIRDMTFEIQYTGAPISAPTTNP